MLVICSECGKQISDKAKVCPNCGAPIGANGKAVTVSGLKRTVALVFAIFVFWLGWHNFYLGYKGKAMIEMIVGLVGVFTMPFGLGWLILFVLFIWSLVEVLTCKYDSDGEKLEW